MTIKSRIYQGGSEKEGVWPEGPKKYGLKYWDAESQTFKDGPRPNPNKIYGKAPTVIFDSMPKTYHEAAGRYVESRAEWNQLDKETGSLTFGSIEEPRKIQQKAALEEKKALKADRRRAAEEALKKVRANPKETRERLSKEAEKQAEIAKKSGLTKLLKDEGIKL
jgi:hypothetical protein